MQSIHEQDFFYYIKYNEEYFCIFCMMGNFMLLLSYADFLQSAGTLSECQRIFIQIRNGYSVSPDLGLNCLQRLSMKNYFGNYQAHRVWIQIRTDSLLVLIWVQLFAKVVSRQQSDR